MTAGHNPMALKKGIDLAVGSLVEKLFDGTKSKGEYSVVWNASTNSSGNYFARLEVNGLLRVIKLNLMK